MIQAMLMVMKNSPILMLMKNRRNIDVDELAAETLMNCWQVAQIAPLPIARAAESHSYSTIPTSYYT